MALPPIAEVLKHAFPVTRAVRLTKETAPMFPRYREQRGCVTGYTRDGKVKVLWSHRRSPDAWAPELIELA